MIFKTLLVPILITALAYPAAAQLGRVKYKGAWASSGAVRRGQTYYPTKPRPAPALNTATKPVGATFNQAATKSVSRDFSKAAKAPPPPKPPQPPAPDLKPK